MTLTTRLTLFFLAALGVTLAAFSVAVYALARTHLYRQLDDRATAALDILVAATEIERDGLEWEPHQRTIQLRGDGGPPEWAAYDEAGGRVGGSSHESQLATPPAAGEDPELGQRDAALGGRPWRVAWRTLRYPDPDAVRSTEERKRYRAMLFVTAWPAGPIHDTLSALAWGLGGVSAALWLVACVAGRWACRYALRPVARMTESAIQVSADDLGARLPTPAARDELGDLAGAFNDLLTRLQDSFERQRRFTGEASHQLRTPLTAMIGQLEVALRRERDPEEYRRVLTAAVAQAGRLRQIVEALLFLARADAEAELPDLEWIDLGAWAAEYLAEHGDGWGNEVRFAGPAGDIPVSVQPAMLAQVVGNLLDNARKYSAAGTPIVVTVAVDAGDAVLVVEDGGSGIASADLDRIFQPFFRSPEARRRGVGGVGLGLAVAARVVRSFGGRIEAWSELGKGSRFTIRLPLTSTGE